MILYSKGWGGCSLLCQIRGTSWPHGILPALISTAWGIALGVMGDFNEMVETKEFFMVHPYPFQLFAFIVGFLIVFRTNFAYQRYWEGRSTIAHMDGKWLDGACMSVTFDATGDKDTPYLDGIRSRPEITRAKTAAGSPSHEEFFEEICHLFSLMHALALQHLRQDTDLGNLDGFSLRGRRLTALPEAPKTSGEDKDIKRMMSTSNKVKTTLARATSAERKRESTGPNQNSQDSSQDNQVMLPCLPGNLSDGDVPAPPTNMKSGSNHSLGKIFKQMATNPLDLREEIYKLQRIHVIGDLTAGEISALDRDARGNPIPTGARVAMVEGWIMRRLIARQKHENCPMGVTSPPILSRLYQVISDGTLGFSQASKITDTPFPFPYQNIIQLFLWVYCVTVPFVMNAWLRNWYLRGVLTFLATWSYFAMDQVGRNLEDPYLPYDPNELALTSIQHEFNAKLLAFGTIPAVTSELAPPVFKKQMSDVITEEEEEAEVDGAGLKSLPTGSVGTAGSVGIESVGGSVGTASGPPMGIMKVGTEDDGGTSSTIIRRPHKPNQEETAVSIS